MKKELESKDLVIEELQVRIDDIEQRELALNLEIHNVPEKPNENLKHAVECIAAALGAKESLRGISTAYRSRQQRGKPRVITVEFTNARS